MRNKDHIVSKIEQVEGKLNQLQYLATAGKEINQYLQVLNETKELLDFVKSAIEREDYTN